MTGADKVWPDKVLPDKVRIKCDRIKCGRIKCDRIKCDRIKCYRIKWGRIKCYIYRIQCLVELSVTWGANWQPRHTIRCSEKFWDFFEMKKFPQKICFARKNISSRKNRGFFFWTPCRCEVSKRFQKSHLEHQPIKLKIRKTPQGKRVVFFINTYDFVLHLAENRELLLWWRVLNVQYEAVRSGKSIFAIRLSGTIIISVARRS